MNKNLCKSNKNIYLVLLISFFKINIIQGLGIIKIDKDKFPVETTYIEAIEGRTALLTCPLIAPPSDKIYMVLWFRDDAGIPLYSIDARGKSLQEGQHWSDPKVFGSRAKFILGEPAYLQINEIKRHDQGVYRCRVDFKKSQTSSFKFNLTVIIPPEDPVVLDGWGRPLNSSTIGPKEEGDDVTLTCRVIGGRPQPDVRWLINGVLVDDQYEQNFGNVIENRLLSPSIKRSDLHSIFTCQAVNTHLMEPKEKNYVLDMYLKPLTINITNTSLVLVAEQKYEVFCETTGSRPEALIMWFKGKKQLKKSKEYFINYKIKENYYENKTISELLFVPTHEDDGSKLICHAENPKVSSFFIETSLKLEVHYPPVVNLQLGSTLSINNIKEGDDVYFECHTKSNPQWRKLDWLLNGLPLSNNNASTKVIRSNQSLVLQKVNRFSAGLYQCSAINQQGETRSNKLMLRVKFPPLCTFDQLMIIGASKGENVMLSCDIHTDPEATKFRWRFENSEESIEIEPDRFGSNGTSSVLYYSPIIEQDYGTLSCWGINEVGQQLKPCMFQLIQAGPPSSVKNCSLFNETQQSITVQCQPGYDGGLPQIFVLEIISANDKASRFNATNINEPKFILNSLKFILLKSMKDHENDEDVLSMIVYSVNQKGRSAGTLVKEYVVGNSKKNDTSSLPNLSPIAIGTLVVLIILIVIILVKFYLKYKKRKKRKSRLNEQQNKTNSKEAKDSKCSLLKNHNQNNENLCKKLNLTLSQSNHDKWQQLYDKRNPKMLIDFDFTTDEEKDEPDIISYPRLLSTDKHHASQSNQNHHHHLQHHHNNHTHNNHVEELIPMTSTSHSIDDKTLDLDVNLKGISDLLMSTRVPESCV